MFSTHYDEDAKLWSGRAVVPLYNPKVSVGQVALDALFRHGSKVAQITDHDGIRMTFREIHTNTVRVAQNLQKRGYGPKQMFAIMARNSRHMASIMFSSISIGCTVNPLDPTYDKTVLIHMLKKTKPVLMFCDTDVCDLVEECLNEVGNNAKIFTFGGSKGNSEPIENLLAETHRENAFVPVVVDGVNDAAVINCTSGTTGLPKGICLSHAALLDACSRSPLSCADDILLCFSSMHWVSGIRSLIGGTLSGLTRIITTEVFSPETQFRLVEKYRVTFVVNSLHHLISMAKHKDIKSADLSSIKLQLCGATKIPFSVQAEMNAHLPNSKVYVGYGLSEIVGVASRNYLGGNEKDSVGKLIDGCLAKIVDEHGNRCGPNVDGEICIKVPYKFLGYFGDKSATDELYDAEDFFVTGDIGRFDNDGLLYIRDRKKELFKYNNMQISPMEIESFLVESPQIAAACVVAVPDGENNLPAAAIERAKGSNISEQEVFDLVAEHFADHYKLRGGVYFFEKIPIAPTSKVLRHRVKDALTAQWNANMSQIVMKQHMPSL